MRSSFIYVILAAVLCHFSASTSAQEDRTAKRQIAAGQWSTEKANEWYKEHAPILGCNFLPSTAGNDVEMWQSSSIDFDTMDKELGLLKQFGINSVRVFLNYVVWEAEADKLKANFRKFLDLCEKHQISVMPIIFDRCNFSNLEATFGKQPDPTPGVHNSLWVSSPPQKMMNKPEFDEQLKAYLQDIVKTFQDDRRIIIWDLYNEPEQSSQTHPLMEKAFIWAREVAPLQPLTVGPWSGDFNDPIAKREMELSDIVSFHAYDNREGVERKIALCSFYGRPLVCTEWLHRQGGNTPQTILPLFKEYNVGCYNWGSVAGKTQTYFHWESKPNTPEPEIWQHDLFRRDGTPYQEQEIKAFRDFAD
jgi:beta-galactosidase/beta-glucuronidase